MNIADKKNGGACALTAYAGAAAATAGGTGDTTLASGPWLDRSAGGTTGLFGSVKIVAAFTTTLAANKALNLAFQLQDAADGSGTGAAAFGTAYASTAIASSVSGGTVTGTVEFDVDLTMARQFIRAQVTPDLTATGTDTAALTLVAVWFGSDRLPIGKSLI